MLYISVCLFFNRKQKLCISCSSCTAVYKLVVPEAQSYVKLIHDSLQVQVYSYTLSVV